MKKIFLSVLVASAVIFSIQAQKASKTVLVTLQGGEQLVYNENCFNIMTGGKNSLIFTSKSVGDKVQYFYYENGVKKGPFNEIKPEMVKCSGAGLYGKSCARQANSVDLNDQMNKYVTIDQADGKSTIKLNGKIYGPYYAISQLVVTADNKKFYAIVVNVTTLKSEFVCSDGRVVAVGGSADAIIVSPDGNEAYMFQKGLVNIEDLIKSGGDITKINMNDLNKVLMVSISGKKLGPFDDMQSGDFWFCKTNNNLIYRLGYDIYVNGVKFLSLKDNPDPCTFWISADSKRYAIVSYDKILFSDGESFPYPLEVEYINENGNTYLSWAALENGTNIVLYKKEL